MRTSQADQCQMANESASLQQQYLLNNPVSVLPLAFTWHIHSWKCSELGFMDISCSKC